jgi:hypothetical protein
VETLGGGNDEVTAAIQVALSSSFQNAPWEFPSSLQHRVNLQTWPQFYNRNTKFP